MKKVEFLLLISEIVTLLVMYGFILPALLSASSNWLVFFGIAIIIITVLFYLDFFSTTSKIKDLFKREML